jgi:hypothetical protein
MSDSPHPATPDPEPAARGPTQADWRADYDDEFGRVRTPRQIARRRLMIPAIDFLFLGVCGLLASLIAAVSVFATYIEDAADPLEYLEMVGLLAAIAVGGGVSALIVAAGDGMLRLRRHTVALVAAYIVTSLSLASVWAILFYPFGIWALVLLYKTEVRKEFDRPPGSVEADEPNRPRRPKAGWPFMLAGGLGFAVMLLAFALVAGEAQAGVNQWEDWELVLAYALLGVGIMASAGVVVYGFVRSRRNAGGTGPERTHAERPERPAPGPEAGPAADV